MEFLKFSYGRPLLEYTSGHLVALDLRHGNGQNCRKADQERRQGHGNHHHQFRRFSLAKLRFASFFTMAPVSFSTGQVILYLQIKRAAALSETVCFDASVQPRSQ